MAAGTTAVVNVGGKLRFSPQAFQPQIDLHLACVVTMESDKIGPIKSR